MDSNKDEAERCTELAERFMRERKYEEAEKFIRKAQKLYPTKKAEGTCDFQRLGEALSPLFLLFVSKRKLLTFHFLHLYRIYIYFLALQKQLLQLFRQRVMKQVSR